MQQSIGRRAIVLSLVLSFASLGSLASGCGGSGASTPSPTDSGVDTSLPEVAPVEDAGDEALPGDADAADTADAAPVVPPYSPDLVAVAGPCADAVPSVYVTPTGLPAFGPAARGDVVRCAKDGALDLATVDAALSGNGLKATTSVSIYRVSFRTTRGNGSAGASTALVYLPDTPRAGPLPVVVVAHPTEGMAPSCAPSKNEANLRELGLPWAGRGYAVIAPDYAGLGNEGVQGYQDNRDTAYSTLDAARALRKLLRLGAFSDQVLVSGFSQGGGAALSAQALAKDYGAGGTLAAVVVFAPQWASRPTSFGLGRLLADPEALTIANGITNPVVATMRSYAWFYNYVSTGDGTTPFPPSIRAGVQGALQTMCLKEFGGYLQGVAPYVKQIFDAPFRASLTACLADAKGSGCVEPGKSYAAFLRGNVVKADAKGAPILYVQGLLDQILPANTEAACNLIKLAYDGVKPQVCADALGMHSSVVGRNVSLSVDWAEAVLAGKPPPACSDAGMPTCVP